MKRIFILASLIVMSSLVYGRPFLTEEATVLPVKTLEAGLEASYGVDNSEIADEVNSPEYTGSLTSVHIPVRYGVSDKLELNLNLPYRSWKNESDPDDVTYDGNESGLGQVSVGGKYGICGNSALLLEVQTPTGDVDKGLGEGTNVLIGLAHTREVSKINPADPIIIRAAAEYSLNSISLIGEAQMQVLGKAKVADVSIADTNGTTIDFLAGTQYTKDNLKLKLGFEWAVGDEDLRAGGAHTHFSDSWDWKIFLSGSYKFEM